MSTATITCEEQTFHRCAEWPVVLPNDHGIRPAGPQDECLYCQQKVGQKHRADCVCVYSLNRYEVWENGNLVGRWLHADPYDWTFEDCEFHANESSWCVDNALEWIEWTGEEAKQRAEHRSLEGCNCGALEFRWVCTVDPGPFVVLRDSIS